MSKVQLSRCIKFDMLETYKNIGFESISKQAGGQSIRFDSISKQADNIKKENELFNYGWKTLMINWYWLGGTITPPK